MKKRFLIFALSLLIICGFILARDFYIINKRKTLHKGDCCGGSGGGEISIDVCFPCCDEDNNIGNIILLKKKYNRTINNYFGGLPCHYH